MRLLTLLVTAALMPLPGRQPAAPAVERLTWLSGCWSLARPDGLTEEHWMAPRGGTMLGMSRTVKGDRTVEYEFLQIRMDNGVLAYEAHPSGQAPTVFRLKSLETDAVTFENPAHDFPQRISYRRTAGGVTARVEGGSDSSARGIDFPFVRCGR